MATPRPEGRGFATFSQTLFKQIKETSGKYFKDDYMVWDRLQDGSSGPPRQQIKPEHEPNKLSGPLSADVLDAVTQAFKELDFSQAGQYTMEPLRETPRWLQLDFPTTEIAKITLPKGAFWLSFEDMKANDPLNLTRFFPTIFGLRKEISNAIWWIGLKKLSNQISPFQGPKG